MTRIHDAISRAIQHGVTPEDVFLGPEERRRIIEAWHVGNASSVVLTDGTFKYRGMTIRFMEKDGVRVGSTFDSGEENKGIASVAITPSSFETGYTPAGSARAAGSPPWRLLKNDEPICVGDELLRDDCETWEPLKQGHFFSQRYNCCFHVPMRRRVSENKEAEWQ